MTDNITTAANACIDRVRLYNNVTFPELMRVLDEHDVPTAGTYSFELSKLPNVILWADMSDEFCDVAARLYDHEHIEVRPAHYLTYLCEGGMLRLPLAKRPTRRGYKKPHWAPVVFAWTGHRAQLHEARGALRSSRVKVEGNSHDE